MKILYYSPHPTINSSAPSGPGTHIREVIGGFEQHGHTVVRLISGGEELNVSGNIQFKKNKLKKFVPLYLWQTLKDYRLLQKDTLNRQHLERLVQEEKPDMIYERSYYLMRSGFETAKKFGIKYCCEMNAPYPEEKVQMEGKSFFIGRAKNVERQQVSTSHRVFTVSSAMKDYLLKNTGCKGHKIVVIPNAVNEQKINADGNKIEEIRARHGLRNDDKIIGFVGSIFPYHGVDLLLSTFVQLIKNEHANFKLMIVGDGEILGQLREFAKLNIPDGRVIFTGNIHHRDVYSHIALMDITVMARSNWYGSPVKIFEYGALGKTIIAPDTIPVRDVMVDAKDGILIPDNRDDLLKAMEYLIANPDIAAAMAKSFQDKVLKKHTWKNVTAEILKEIQ